jgi:hypothetical protein
MPAIPIARVELVVTLVMVAPVIVLLSGLSAMRGVRHRTLRRTAVRAAAVAGAAVLVVAVATQGVVRADLIRLMRVAEEAPLMGQRSPTVPGVRQVLFEQQWANRWAWTVRVPAGVHHPPCDPRGPGCSLVRVTRNEKSDPIQLEVAYNLFQCRATSPAMRATAWRCYYND